MTSNERRDDEQQPPPTNATPSDRPRSPTIPWHGAPHAPNHPGRGQSSGGTPSGPRAMVAARREHGAHPIVRLVVLASEAGVNEREQRVWCAGRASVHLDVALAQIADAVPCVERLDDEVADRLRTLYRDVWAVRESLFTIVEEIDPEVVEIEAPAEGG